MNPYNVLKKYEGQYIKYPKLCEIIGEERKSGRSRMLHLNRIKQYVDLSPENGKIYIGRVYTDDDELKIIENHGKFTTYIRQFLINLFYDYGTSFKFILIIILLPVSCSVKHVDYEKAKKWI